MWVTLYNLMGYDDNVYEDLSPKWTIFSNYILHEQ